MRRIMTAAIILGLLLAPATAAFAGCPDSHNSSVGPCLVVCPAGDAEFPVTVRFPTNDPVAGMSVVLDFGACPGFHLSPPNGTETYHSDSAGRFVWMYSDRNGMVLFHVRGGGGSGGMVVVSTCNSFLSDGTPDPTPDSYIVLGSRTLVTPDQDGDLVVTAQDIAQVTNAVGTANASDDFNCDGTVTSTDVGIASAHLGHAGGGAVPVVPATWGSLKIRYR